MIELNDPVSKQMFAEHDQDPSIVHTNLMKSYCSCNQVVAKPPIQAGLPDGGVCFKCGGMTIRTGTCTHCTTCGEGGGCG